MHSKEYFNRLLPRRAVKLFRTAALVTADLYHRLQRSTDELTPPRALHSIGGGDFKEIGTEFFGYFRNLCKVKPAASILDIGCGTGRMAVPLLNYLDDNGAYTGFDISRKAIRWCNGRIAAKRSNFKFLWADIYNREYHPKGQIAATEYRFPCPDETIDLVFAASVFTHMLPDEVRHYLDEIHRVLKKDGCCLLTYYLLNDDALALMENQRSRFNFHVPLPGCYSVDAKTPERAVAFTEAAVRELHRQARLAIREPIYFGNWCGRSEFLSSQDIVIAGPSGGGD